MSEIAIIQYLAALAPWVGYILMGLGGAVVVGQAVVALTPSQADDAVMSKILNVPILGGILTALAAFAPIQKKS